MVALVRVGGEVEGVEGVVEVYVRLRLRVVGQEVGMWREMLRGLGCVISRVRVPVFLRRERRMVLVAERMKPDCASIWSGGCSGKCGMMVSGREEEARVVLRVLRSLAVMVYVM